MLTEVSASGARSPFLPVLEMVEQTSDDDVVEGGLFVAEREEMIGRRSLLLSVLVAAAIVPATAAGQTRSRKLKAVLWIGGFAHDFEAVAKVIEPAMEKLIPAEIELVRGGKFLDRPDVGKLDVILMYHCYKEAKGVLTEKQQAKLLELVRGGMGVVALHASYYSFETWNEVRKLYGARFTRHGSTKALLVVRTVDKKHPIMKDLDDDFCVVSELYESTPLAKDCRVLGLAKEMGTDKEHPSVWTRTYGKGRVVTILPGHWADNFHVVGFQKLIARSALWVAGRLGPDDEKKKGTP